MLACVREQVEILRLPTEKAILPLAEFESGTTFVMENYGEGTIVRVTSERVYPREDPENAYSTGSLLGIIVNTKGITEHDKHALLYVVGNSIVSGEIEKIEVGRVHHHISDQSDRIFEKMERVTKVEIVSVNTGTRSHVKKAGRQSVGSFFGNIMPRAIPS